MFLWLTSVSLSSIFAASIGVSPGGISNENLKPGATVTQEFIISRSNPDEDSIANIIVDAEDIKNWVKITPGENIPLPAGEQRVPFTVTIDVPKDAKFGKYEGGIRVQLDNFNKGQVTIQPAVMLEINLFLTEKDIKLIKVTNAVIENYYYGDPLILFLDFINEGNIAASPDSIKVEVYTEALKLVDTIETDAIPKVEPFQQGTVQIRFNDVSFTSGKYIGEVFVAEQGEVIYKGRSVFEVYKSGKTIEGKDDGTKNFVGKIKENIVGLLKSNWNRAKSFAKDNFKYILIGFVSLSFILILLLLVLDRDRDEDEEKRKRRGKR